MGIIIVGGIIEKDGKFLLVQEAQEKCIKLQTVKEIKNEYC